MAWWRLPTNGAAITAFGTFPRPRNVPRSSTLTIHLQIKGEPLRKTLWCWKKLGVAWMWLEMPQTHYSM